MRSIALTVILALFAASVVRGAEPASFSPAALAAQRTRGGHVEQVISVFPPGGKEFEISLPLIPHWFAFGRSGTSVYTTTLSEIAPKSFTDLGGMSKVELEPMRVSTIEGLDAFYSIGPFAVSQSEDLIVFSGAKGNYPAGSCGVYKLDLPTGDIRPVIETSDCLAGSPWRVLSLSPEKTEALISPDRRTLALLDLSRGSIMRLEGQLYKGSFSPDGKWIAALQIRNPKPPRTILIDRTDLALRSDLGSASNNETWSPDSRFLLQTVYRSACPQQNPLALETVDVQTGNHLLIRDSICHSGSGGQIGWVRPDVNR